MFGISPQEFWIFGSLIVVTLVWFWSLIDCAIRDHERDMDKLVWVAIIISTYILGSIAYVLVWRPRTSTRRPVSAGAVPVSGGTPVAKPNQ
ncbi:MAG: PLDc N-terminal domain-containing protein [Acidobacteriota bacterium]|nr:PLDc N-terminal domain-containing protein [Acidobacteriota bacterium]